MDNLAVILALVLGFFAGASAGLLLVRSWSRRAGSLALAAARAESAIEIATLNERGAARERDIENLQRRLEQGAAECEVLRRELAGVLAHEISHIAVGVDAARRNASSRNSASSKNAVSTRPNPPARSIASATARVASAEAGPIFDPCPTISSRAVCASTPARSAVANASARIRSGKRGSAPSGGNTCTSIGISSAASRCVRTLRVK